MVREYRKAPENVHFLPVLVFPTNPPLAAATTLSWWCSSSFRTLHSIVGALSVVGRDGRKKCAHRRWLCHWIAIKWTSVDLQVSEFRSVENVFLTTRNVPQFGGHMQPLSGHLGWPLLVAAALDCDEHECTWWGVGEKRKRIYGCVMYECSCYKSNKVFRYIKSSSNRALLSNAERFSIQRPFLCCLLYCKSGELSRLGFVQVDKDDD